MNKAKTSEQLIMIANDLIAKNGITGFMNTEGKQITASASNKIKEIILKYDESGLESDAQRNKAHKSANVFHHMYGEKKYIGVNSIEGKPIRGNVYDEYRCALKLTSSNQMLVEEGKKEIQSGIFSSEEIKEIKDISLKIRKEIKSCVLISKEFHDWLSPRLKGNTSLTYRGYTYPLDNRDDYYKLYRKFSKDKTCLKKMTKISFENNSLIDAIYSLGKLKEFINDNLNIHSTKTIKKIESIYNEIYAGIKDDNIYINH